MKDDALHHLNNFALEYFTAYGMWPDGRSVYGHELETGDVLVGTDVYNSSNGSWEQCTCPGLMLGKGTTTKWIRPVS